MSEFARWRFIYVWTTYGYVVMMYLCIFLVHFENGPGTTVMLSEYLVMLYLYWLDRCHLNCV